MLYALVLYKVITLHAWERTQASDRVSLSDSDTAFIHFSEKEDVERIRKKFFSTEPTVVILEVDASRLPGRMVKEKNPGGQKEYYHLYEGFLPRSAIASHQIVDNPRSISQ